MKFGRTRGQSAAVPSDPEWWKGDLGRMEFGSARPSFSHKTTQYAENHDFGFGFDRH
jgi:hypothetical protein